jgi:dsDNA-specific endonuclease/ATPase MutS2
MKAVGKFLENQPYIKKFNFANEDHGGAGITQVEFKQ